ncbi:MAG: DNA polymerase III subunit delta [Vicinamibacterales bacterium]
MPNLTEAALRASIAAGTLGPLYVLTGADEMEKSAMAQEFIESIDEGLRAFNVERLYGAETSADQLADAAATFPMMAPRRIVLVFAAEGLLIPKRESKAADEAQARLEAFIDNPPDHATVVFVCSDLDRRRRLVKRLIERAHVVDCGTISDLDGAERWIKTRAAQAAVPLDAGAARALASRAGTDIVRLRAGLERVALYALGQATITAEDVRASVVAGPESPEDFGIANAIGVRNPKEALDELGRALDAGAQPFFLLGQIRSAAERQTPDRLRGAMDAVLRTDIALKSTGGDARVLLERLVMELCGPSRGSSPNSAGRPAFRR